MNEKDYVIADVIACQFRDSFDTSKPVIRGLTYALATRLALLDPRFDREKFMRAAGVVRGRGGELAPDVEESEGYKQAAAQLQSLRELVDAMCADGYESEDDARQRIEESPLCVDVRSDWTAAGAVLEPAEYRILLCTGGPAVQITGDLDEHNEAHNARLQFQDWFTPWRDYPTSEEEDAALLTYARVFYFGE